MSIEAMKQWLEALENIMLERDLDSATTIARNVRYGLRQAIQAAEKQEQDTLAYREAARLAKWLFNKHYAHEEHYASGRVVWGLCDTTAGVISQIDNMVCQLVKAENQEPINEEAFQAYCKTLHPLWNTRISRTEAEGFFKAGYEAATLEQNNGQNTP